MEVLKYLENSSKFLFDCDHIAETRALDLLCLCPTRTFRLSGDIVFKRPHKTANNRCSVCGLYQHVEYPAISVSASSGCAPRQRVSWTEPQYIWFDRDVVKPFINPAYYRQPEWPQVANMAYRKR